MHKTKLNNNKYNNKTKTAFNTSSASTATLLSATTTTTDDLHHHPQQQHHHHLQNQQQYPAILDSSIASIDLEQYIEAMEARTTAIERNPETDVWTQLQQKESDILLAAELGKALLEKNEELVKQQEKLIEDYSAKIEVSYLTKNYYHQLLYNYENFISLMVHLQNC